MTGIAAARQAMQAGRADLAVPMLDALHRDRPSDIDIARLLGFALRQEQRLVEAESVFAAATGTSDPGCSFGLAQTRYELGLPSATLFEQAGRLDPANPDIVKNRAAAMAAEGDTAGAERLLGTALAQHPAWLDGHKGLATLRWTRGDQTRFVDSYATACRAQPEKAALWLAWFAAVTQTRDWAAAGAILDQAEQHLGTTAGIAASRFFLASESGDTATADALFAATGNITGDATNLTRIRYLLRRGRFAEAQDLALPLTRTTSATLFWPYLSLIWRLTGDARHEWLDRPETSIKSVDVDLTASEYIELAEVLRGLHDMARPYVEQSVRGGTQTDRSVMLRHEPILQRTRAAWIDAIRGYVADLPPLEEGHPLLGTPRTQLLIEGSWSVRLLRQGHNVPHTHPMGWLSTAFYIALPDTAAMGPPPAGHIAFGTPPADLGLDLKPYRTIVPRVGQSAVFPSTMWHSTLPFDDGERLVLALDVRRPAY
ncbi:putative 2OG-Fe(II) oxygenase [Sphingomonas sp. SUN039]|uniref:2OG-Fe(II) oxygenase family protein n=1 Tax=Sphingomonas sp. SUN039 TaxID=2937787 RepID=UPI0021649477|nr:putative 2OG-Fe(II) oxygenase [Sphingomonas sp. SUN039]UVO53496.1 putative 2OG-Fe(II) oxygenase [Sphingomonas sp. SUN039]